ncbi:MAG: formaldehyde-activating enzyme [Fuerstiella sp.]
MSMYVGESLIGEGLEVAHIDLLIGDKSGPVGAAFASALADQNMGHSNLLAVMEPNVAVKPSTVMITKVTIKGAKQAVQMFGPAQKAVADAVCDCVKSGVIPKDQADNLCIVCGVFIHWQAEDDKKIYEYNYAATKESIERAMKNEPSVDEMLAQRDTASHPYYKG